MDIGDPILTQTVTFRRGAEQGFAIEWYSDEALTVPKVDISGKIIRLVIGDVNSPVAQFDTVCVSNTSTLSFDGEDTDLPFELYDGLLIFIDGSNEVPLFNLRIEVGPS